MRRVLLGTFLVLAGLVQACSAPFLHPLATDRNTVYEASMIGTWKEVDPDDGAKENRYTVTRAESPGGGADRYVVEVRYRPGDGRELATARIDAAHVRLGPLEFLDFSLSESEREKVGDVARMFSLPVHYVMRLDRPNPEDQDIIRLSELSGTWLDEQLRKDDGILRHEHLDQDKLLITASTDEIEAFFRKYGATDEAYSEFLTLMRDNPNPPGRIVPTTPDRP